jgi:2-polyprenyl-3-methyl-5-hydroxy-6-metoxy-1,4-benzoquinol methylase
VNGGYDDGYAACPCFWGTTPGSFVESLVRVAGNLTNLTVLDAGCGEGKNAAYLAKLGCQVRAIDISELALRNARKSWDGLSHVSWEAADVRNLCFGTSEYDIVLAYGLLHCLNNVREIDDTVGKLQNATRPSGYNVLCALNHRFQQLDAHPGLVPCLVQHQHYLRLYSSWQLIRASDSDLVESHPHNLVEHRHSLTRILARKM